MKKWLFIFGTLSLMLMSLGFLFRTLQWEGAGFLLVFGVAILSLVLIAAAIRMKSMIIYTAALSVFFILLSTGFKVLHLAGAGILMAVGVFLFSLIFLPMLGWRMYRDSERNKKGE